MPNITEFTSPIDKLTPSEIPEQTYQQAGRQAGRLASATAQQVREGGAAWGVAGREVGHGLETLGATVEKHAAQQEIISGIGALAETADQLHDHYGQYVLDNPDNPNVTQQWRQETLNPTLQKFTEQFNTPQGKEWAATHAAELATQMYRFTTASDMERAGDAAHQAITQSTNTLSNMVAKNPGSLDTALSLVPGSISAIVKNSNLKPDLAAKMGTTLTQTMQHEIVVSGLKAAFVNNPQGALDLLNSGKYDQYISGTEREQFLKFGAAQEKRAELGQRSQIVQARRAEDDNIKANAVGLQQSTMTEGGGTALPPDYWDNLNKLAMSPGGLRHPELINELNRYGKHILETQEKEQKQNAKIAAKETSDPNTLNQALDQAAQGNLSHAQILAMGGKGLSLQDSAWLALSTADDAGKADLARLKDTLDVVKNKVAGSDPASRTENDLANYGVAQAAVIDAWRRGRNAGIPVDELVDPNNKSYIGTVGASVLPPVNNKAPPKFLHPFKMSEADTGAYVGTGAGGRNNPGNLKTSSGGWAQFASAAEGTAAIGDWLIRAQEQHGADTVAKLIERYAPQSDPGNRGKPLIAEAARRVGVAPNEPVDMTDPDMRTRMVSAILAQEGARPAIPSLASIFSGHSAAGDLFRGDITPDEIQSAGLPSGRIGRDDLQSGDVTNTLMATE